MKQKLRARCPCCGMIADVDRFSGDRYEIKAYLQTFGGKVSPGEGRGKGSGKGSTPGFMQYDEITNTPDGKDIVRMIKRRMK